MKTIGDVLDSWAGPNLAERLDEPAFEQRLRKTVQEGQVNWQTVFRKGMHVLEYNAVPLRRVGPIEFGMPRHKVREALTSDYIEFQKGGNSVNTTDDFGFLHVYYDKEDRCIAVELFEDCRVSVDGVVVFPASIAKVQRIIRDLVEDAGSYISKSDSVGIYAPGGTPEAILFGCEGYYS